MYLESRRGDTVPAADPETRTSDRRTFDVLFVHSGPADTAFAAIGEVSDDIDLKDGKHGGEQGLALATWVAGIVPTCSDDNPRLGSRRHRVRRALSILFWAQMNKEVVQG